MSSFQQNKVNLSLDEIIKMEKAKEGKQKNVKGSTVKGRVTKKQQRSSGMPARNKVLTGRINRRSRTSLSPTDRFENFHKGTGTRIGRPTNSKILTTGTKKLIESLALKTVHEVLDQQSNVNSRAVRLSGRVSKVGRGAGLLRSQKRFRGRIAKGAARVQEVVEEIIEEPITTAPKLVMKRKVVSGVPAKEQVTVVRKPDGTLVRRVVSETPVVTRVIQRVVSPSVVRKQPVVQLKRVVSQRGSKFNNSQGLRNRITGGKVLKKDVVTFEPPKSRAAVAKNNRMKDALFGGTKKQTEDRLKGDNSFLDRIITRKGRGFSDKYAS